MVYKEIEKDLFSLDSSEYVFAHCISADFAMGAGIAPQFEKHFNTKTKLLNKYNDELMCNTYLNDWRERIKDKVYGDCIYVAPVFNLITKEFCYEKPTYRSLFDALLKMRSYCRRMGVKKLAMPKISCGLDGLNWNEVKKMIFNLFNDENIEITVCYIN